MKYNEAKFLIIEEVRRGETYKAACMRAGVSDSQFFKWKGTKTDFAESIKKAREEWLQARAKTLVDSLMRRANGYKYKETKTEYVSGVNGQPQILKQTTTEKEVVPDTGAIIFALTNIDPENWKNRQNTTVEGAEGKPVRISFDDIVKPLMDRMSETKDKE